MTISTPVRPTGEQAQEARECLETLKGSPQPTLTVKLEGGTEFEVPEFALHFLLQLLQETAKGNAVTLIPVHSELTTQQAADLLNVSRPYVVKLLESGEIPFRKRGRHRRIRFDDLMQYKSKDELERGKVFDEMVELSEGLGVGYEQGPKIYSQNFTVIYDACVLYPFSLRDLLIQLAMRGLFKARWSTTINDEWSRNLLKNNPQLDSTKVQRTVQLMSDAVRDWEVMSFQDLIPSLSLPDDNDRHVLAAAIKANADAIITLNLKHFPESGLSPHGIEALHPDDFVLDLIDLNGHQVLEAARHCWQRRRKPPLTWEQYLASLERSSLPQSAEKLREVAEF